MLQSSVNGGEKRCTGVLNLGVVDSVKHIGVHAYVLKRDQIKGTRGRVDWL